MDAENLKILMEIDEDEETEKENSSSEKAGQQELEFYLMEDFPNHKFILYDGQRLNDMVDSIKQFGILTPLIIWKHNGKHTILSGHNRKKAGLLAGLAKAPVTIKTDLTMDEAKLIVSETNLRQRSFSDMKHSERAFCLKEHYKAMKNQGIRKDLIEAIEQNIMQNKNNDFSDNDTENLNRSKIQSYDEKVAKLEDKYKLNHATISQYIRIAELTQELLDLLDEGYIAFAAAYQFTFINDIEAQKAIAKVVRSGVKILAAKAKILREHFEKKGSLSEEEIKEILKKPPKKTAADSIINQKDVKKFFTGGESKQQIKDTIIEVLEMYYSDYLKRKEQANE